MNRNYNHQKEEVQREINKLITQIHTSIDCWTSPQKSMNLQGIVRHFKTHQGNRKNPVLAVREIEGSHNGNALAEIVVKVIIG